jgi:hypothetical protein
MQKLIVQLTIANADADESYSGRDIVPRLAQTVPRVANRVTRAPKELETSWKESRRL